MPFEDSTGRLSCRIAINDITERKKTEAALRESRLFKERISDAIPYILYVYNLADQKNIYVNKAVTDILGYTAEEVTGTGLKPIDTLIHPEDRDKTIEHLKRVAASKDSRVFENEYRTKHANGEWLRLKSRDVVLARTEDGLPELILGTAEDISDRRKAEEELNLYRKGLEDLVRARTIELEKEIVEHRRTEKALLEAKKAAETANRAKSEFLANISHEIRSPMTAITGMASLLEETSLTKEQIEYVKILKKSGDTLLDLINDVLELSKIEAGHFDIKEVDFTISELIKKTIDILSLRSHNQGIKLDSSIKPDVPGRVRGDAKRIRQVLVNLISNAVKFTKQGMVSVDVGIVCDIAQITQGRSPRSSLNLDHCWKTKKSKRILLQFSVSDSGIGIAKDKLDIIFDNFIQADSSITRNFAGTGLGLSISKKSLKK